MHEMPLFEDPRSVLKQYGLRTKKSWGQNFLVSEKSVRIIASACVYEPGVLVIEIGAGVGTLTHALLTLGAEVVAIERDPEMCAILKDKFTNRDRFTLAEADAATFDYATLMSQSPGVIAGNLPYQITGRILRQVLQSELRMKKAVFMVQKEVADRICAGPGEKERGALSVIVEARCNPKIIHRLKPAAFHPPPRVHSAVLELVPKDKPVFGQLAPDLFDRAVKAAFGNRRKTIRNSLLNSGIVTADQVDHILNQSGIDPGIRAERLSATTFADLTAALSENLPVDRQQTSPL